MQVIEKGASPVTKEKCVVADRDPAINLLRRAKRTVRSLLFLQSSRHSFEASSSFLHRIEKRGDRSGDCDEAPGVP
jgi:hypothetical protein